MTELLDNLKRYWGFDSLRPLQEDAIAAVMDGRDSLCVLPTGGGKSLCYQLPATLMDGMAVVVSPLIALMKDQVDALRACGVSAAFVNSTLTESQRRETWEAMKNGDLDLLYVTPERLMQERFLGVLSRHTIPFIAVDEAHCVSEWGHDFRPEYRELGTLKEALPGAPIHAFTATATPHVRDDILRALRLEEPDVVVGSFDRPNLVYHVQERTDIFRQVKTVVDQNAGESGIVYCIRRKDVDELHGKLSEAGYKSAPYHAGLADYDRTRAQEAFVRDDVDIIVATIAFGMGVDKPDVRYVVHTGMPKSIENYQQESGRAGRDGLSSSCHLFYGGNDLRTWRFITQDLPAEVARTVEGKLKDVMDYCGGVTCRHKTLAAYFGETLPSDDCGACDVCLGIVDTVDGGEAIACAVIRAVLNLDERFGGAYIADVLAGAMVARVKEQRHDASPSFGALQQYPKTAVRNWVEQVVGQGFLCKEGEYNIVKVTDKGRALLEGESTARLLKPSKKEKKSKPSPAASALSSKDKNLFEELRALRKKIANEKGVPPYVVFGDKSLRSMALLKPTTRAAFLGVHGVGEKKADEYAAVFMNAIEQFLMGDDESDDDAPEPEKRDPRDEAYARFRDGAELEAVCRDLGLSAGRGVKMLCEFIQSEGVSDPYPWVNSGDFELVGDHVSGGSIPKAKRVFDSLEGRVPYHEVQIALAVLSNR